MMHDRMRHSYLTEEVRKTEFGCEGEQEMAENHQWAVGAGGMNTKCSLNL